MSTAGQMVIVHGDRMTERRFVIVLNVGIFVLLVVLVMEAAGMRRSLRRIERERRLVVHEPFKNFAASTADSPWQNATDGAWILLPFGFGFGYVFKLRTLLSSILHTKGL